MGIPEWEERTRGMKSLFKEIVTENFTNLGKRLDTQIHKTKRTRNYCNTKKPSPRHMILKLSSSVQSQSCVTLCDTMNHSTPGLPVHHQLPEFTQTHVHRVSDAIQPSHPLLSPSTPAPIPPSIRVFSNESTLRIRWPRYWIFSFSISPSNEYPGLTSFKMDWLNLLTVQENWTWNNRLVPNRKMSTSRLYIVTLLI